MGSNRAVNTEQIETAVRLLLRAIGQEPTAEGLRDTPARVARLWREFIDYDPGTTDTTFEAREADQMVILSGLTLWSMCEHHLIPFSCRVAIGYIPRGALLGLSKLARIAQLYAHSLQLQERLVGDIADHVMRVTDSPDVAVLASGEHLCMSMRGIRAQGTFTSSAMRGAFREEAATRAEFLQLAGAAHA